jgi:1-acyl-sn-glycerol-3-phosphate acyltransferase
MNSLLFPIRFLYKVYFFLYFVLSLVLFYPLFKYLLSKKERFPKAFKLIRIYAKVWLYGSGIFLRVKGRNNIISNQPFLICSNHSSFIDPATLYIIFDQYFVFTGKKEIEKWPLFHIFYTSGMNILVDRHNRLGALKSFKKMMDVIAEGKPLVILPEGTIPQNAPKLGDFKAGAVSIAIQMGIPILPITQTTNWKRLQRGSLFKGNASPGIAEVIIHPIIPTDGLTKQDADALSLKLKAVINQPLHEKYGV